jgi:hypothetical protein
MNHPTIIPRTDSIFTSKPNAYSSPTNQQNLANISIREDLLNSFLIRLTRCITLHFIKAIAIICIFIFSTLLFIECLIVKRAIFTKDLSDFCLPYAIYIEMIYIVLIIIYVLAHRQMLKRAQYIIDLENRRQGIYKFSLSPVNLALNIVITGDTERVS